MTGRFIVLEGIDGCGKTTQIQHLVEWLPNSGLMPKGAAVVCTREPGGTPLGRSIRELLLHTADQEAPAPTAELLLYAADRAQHVETLIRPALERGDWVISDRFSGSTLAYQGYGRGLDQDLIQRLEGIATTGCSPISPSGCAFPFKRACSAVSGIKRTASKPRELHSWSVLHRVLPSWPSSAPGAPVSYTHLTLPTKA